MLARIGVGTVDELFADLPEGLRNPPLEVPPALTEPELMRLLRRRAGENTAGSLVGFLAPAPTTTAWAVGELWAGASSTRGTRPTSPR